MKEYEVSKKYKKIKDVTLEECYTGGKHCASCMYMKDHDNYFNYFEHSYCTICSKNKE